MRVRNASLLAAAAGLLMASAANAGYSATIQLIVENADDGTELGRIEQVINEEGATFNWSILQSYNFGGATVSEFRIGGIADPVVSSNFNVAAGPFNTTFTINSVVVSFGTNETLGRAAAGMTFTDSLNAGTPGTIGLTGLLLGGNAYNARYNGANLFAAGSLLPTTVLTVTPGDTDTYLGQSDAGFNFLPLGGVANSINSQFKFTLSAFDRAAGTSVFEVVPAPGSISLLGLGGLLAFRRRRSA